MTGPSGDEPASTGTFACLSNSPTPPGTEWGTELLAEPTHLVGLVTLRTYRAEFDPDRSRHGAAILERLFYAV